jgi:hypothetical protein
MNRSLTNVLFGGIAPVAQTPGQEIKGTITKTTVEETVEAMANAESVIIVRLFFSFTSVPIGQESPLSQLLWRPPDEPALSHVLWAPLYWGSGSGLALN